MRKKSGKKFWTGEKEEEDDDDDDVTDGWFYDGGSDQTVLCRCASENDGQMVMPILSRTTPSEAGNNKAQ